MTQKAKLLRRLRERPANSRFDDLVRAVEACGFVYSHTRGSHRFYQHSRIPHLQLNLQPQGKDAKGYQVRDFLRKLDSYNLGQE